MSLKIKMATARILHVVLEYPDGSAGRQKLPTGIQLGDIREAIGALNSQTLEWRTSKDVPYELIKAEHLDIEVQNSWWFRLSWAERPDVAKQNDDVQDNQSVLELVTKFIRMYEHHNKEKHVIPDIVGPYFSIISHLKGDLAALRPSLLFHVIKANLERYREVVTHDFAQCYRPHANKRTDHADPVHMHGPVQALRLRRNDQLMMTDLPKNLLQFTSVCKIKERLMPAMHLSEYIELLEAMRYTQWALDVQGDDSEEAFTEVYAEFLTDFIKLMGLDKNGLTVKIVRYGPPKLYLQIPLDKCTTEDRRRLGNGKIFGYTDIMVRCGNRVAFFEQRAINVLQAHAARAKSQLICQMEAQAQMARDKNCPVDVGDPIVVGVCHDWVRHNVIFRQANWTYSIKKRMTEPEDIVQAIYDIFSFLCNHHEQLVDEDSGSTATESGEEDEESKKGEVHESYVGGTGNPAYIPISPRRPSKKNKQRAQYLYNDDGEDEEHALLSSKIGQRIPSKKEEERKGRTLPSTRSKRMSLHAVSVHEKMHRPLSLLERTLSEHT
eukprot:m.147916 g.147916  ORF g.147916 m.147916 type:complete len:551 (-) comp14994_c0_seq11:845-2497(-)